MTSQGDFESSRSNVPAADDLLRILQARTPARLAVGRADIAYRTATQLNLWEDHAAAVDAVQREMDLVADFGHEFVERNGLFEVSTLARDKSEYLRRPELGRQLGDSARAEIRRSCSANVDLQVAIGDGLSAAAVAAQVPMLLPLLHAGAYRRGWTVGRPLAIRYCRVGVLNDLGAVLDPRIVVLLIGERPGLATAVSLSAYLAFRPRPGHTDAQRNLISNIHARGVNAETGARRILALAERMRQMQTSGVAVKECLPATGISTAGALGLPVN